MLENIIGNLGIALDQCKSEADLQNVKVKFLGKSSDISAEMKKLGSLSAEQRKEIGQQINQIKQEVQIIINQKKADLDKELLVKKFEEERLDMTLPARERIAGSIHPITQCQEELLQIFSKYGFIAKEGPDIEDDWHNFTALNIAENHPARQMHDTFYLRSNANEEARVLRTHTSPVQIRTMKNNTPPFRIVSPGRTYRSDSDMTHTPMFHQIEGLVVENGITMANLKYVIIDFLKNFFERDNVQVRFRPSFFPFTEPSAEVDIKINKDDSWLEVLGCGMVHPNVLNNVGIDHTQHQGFAFGMGVERLAMLKYGIKDLRKFFEGDKRWLDHYNFQYFDIPTLAGGLTR